MWIDKAKTLGDALGFRSSIDGLAVAGISEVQHQRRSLEHVLYVATQVAAAVEPATLALDGPKKTFLDVVGPGNDDSSRAFPQHVSEQEVGILVQVLHDDVAGFPRSTGTSFPLERFPQVRQDGFVASGVQEVRGPLVLSSFGSVFGADPQCASQPLEDFPVPFRIRHDLQELGRILARHDNVENFLEAS